MKRIQKVRWNTSLVVFNLLIISLFGGTFSFIVTRCLENKMSWVVFVMLVLVFLFLIYTMSKLPLRIEMTDSEVVLQKLVGKVSIPYDQIEIITSYNLTLVHFKHLSGFAGHIGLFQNEEVGRFKAYIGDYRNTFFIRTTKGENYVWSCDNHDVLICEVNEMRRAAQKEELFYYPKE